MKARHALALFLAAAMPVANAVNLNPNGHGQVLIWPYYTANAGHSTLLSIVNDSARTKALKLRFHEGVNGRVVFSANLYLDAHDMWTAGVFEAGDGTAALVTDDVSCTVPDLRNDAALPSLPDGRRYAKFSTADYTGARADGGATDTARTREGHVEIIEMGKVAGDSSAAVRMIYDERLHPADCARLAAAWQPGGYWASNASTDVTAPAGGLVGNATIVNAARGSVLGYPATALDGFSVRSMHTGPDDAHPDLGDALTDEVAGIASAFVSTGTRTIRADYPAERAIDAVSAVLATPYQLGEVIKSRAGSVRTEWILSAPTKRFYVDAALDREAIGQAPFNQRFGTPYAGMACRSNIMATYRDYIVSRDGEELLDFPEPAPRAMLCFDTTVASTSGTPPTPLFGSSNANSAGGSFETGYMRLSWRNARVRAANGGEEFVGLPVIGIQATNWFNGNVTPGVLANYALAVPLRTESECVKGGGDC